MYFNNKSRGDKSINNSIKYIDYLHYVAISILAITAIFLVYKSWNWSYILDVPPIRYVARRILAGELPYRDVIEFNMPFTYLVHVIILLFSESDLALRIADLVFQLIGMIGIFILLKPINLKAAIVAPLLFMCLNIMQGEIHMLQRDVMITCLMPYIAYPFFHLDKVKSYHFILASVVCFCCVLIKPFVLLLLVLLVFVMLFDKRINLSTKKRYVVTIFISIFSAFLTVFIIFAYLGIINDFMEILKILNTFSTGQKNGFWNLKRLIQAMVGLTRGGLILLFIALPICYFLIDRKLSFYVLAYVAYALFHFFIQNKGFSYHLVPLGLVINCLFAYVIFSRKKNELLQLSFGFYFFIFSALILKAAYATTVDFKDYSSKLVTPINTLKQYKFGSVQVLDGCNSGIEIIERLNLKNTYPIYYDFILNYDNHYLINQYRTKIIQGIENADIDMLLFSTETRIMYPDSLVYMKVLAKKNYDSITEVEGYLPTKVLIYKSKKLQKIQQ